MVATEQEAEMKEAAKRCISAVLVICLMAALLSACAGEKKTQGPEAKDIGIIHETEFGGIYIDLTIDEFNNLGFAYGDSLNINISNGYSLEDIPY